MGLAVKLLGEVEIRDGTRVVSFAAAKSLELFCYLLAHRQRPHPREGLCTALWPEEDPRAARRQLRQALWKLNAALGPTEGLAAVDVPRPGWLQLRPGVCTELDIVVFDQGQQVARDVADGELGEEQAAQLDRAVRLYRGDFLAGWQPAWCVPERIRLQDSYLTMLDSLISYCDERRLFARGLDYGRLALAQDQARESTHRRLMRLHSRAGDRPAMVRQYQQCVEVLAEEFGVGPAAPTALLYRALSVDDPLGQPPPRPGADVLAALHRQIDEIQTTVDALARLISPVRPAFEGHLRPRSGPE